MVEQVDVDVVRQWLNDGEALLIDVREQHEYDAGHIIGIIHIPMSTFDPTALPSNGSDQKLVFVCAVGQRSQAVAHHLLNGGYIDAAYNMVGGMHAWREADYPITQK